MLSRNRSFVSVALFLLLAVLGLVGCAEMMAATPMAAPGGRMTPEALQAAGGMGQVIMGLATPLPVTSPEALKGLKTATGQPALLEGIVRSPKLTPLDLDAVLKMQGASPAP